MAALRAFPSGPRAPLPRRIWPVSSETVYSYVIRLADCNHLPVNALHRYLSDANSLNPRPEWLAIASGYPLDLLTDRLIGLSGRHDLAEQHRRARPACRFCMARRGIYEPVHCWLPEYRTVCYRHRCWIGAPARTWSDQRNLEHAPMILAAARQHARMVHRHKDSAAFAMRDARRILTCWWREGRPVTPILALRNLTVADYLHAYRDHVALACALADYQPHIVDGYLQDGPPIRELCHRIKAHFGDRRGSAGAIEQWIYDEHLTMRASTGLITDRLGRTHQRRPALAGLQQVPAEEFGP
ncbi:hypothetical protein [Mycobacteroides abscessus]|uniref:hypothetical protein n=1 Tax=Mycobacteroides abscessus TaxID=36809 RepID=UPI000929A755|nr:hypothetical protein [Mycobacteroides abscessus]MDM2402658.1 hypothetical protein [Mycobacteroides abscessus]MDM2412976.1 hypothetical protein [Mycobacteroides abscessus]SII92656.1 Uncharacterised protein [Mycobacteroides abscessus subsp. abscessus]